MDRLITTITDAYLAEDPASVAREIVLVGDAVRSTHPVLAQILADPNSSQPLRDRALGRALLALRNVVTTQVA